MSRAFLEALAESVPEDERVLISSVPGDPQESAGEMWNVRPWRFGDRAPLATLNNYVCVSSFKRDPQRGWRRTAAQFGRALAFMVDDVGSKIPESAVTNDLLPSARVLTSPGNEQWWWFLAEPVADYELFSRVLSAFVQQRAGGRDPGMAGPNRVARLPGGINGKRQYQSADGSAFRVESVTFRPERRFHLADILAAFRLTLDAPRVRGPVTDVEAEERAKRLADFEELRADCERLGMMLKRRANVSGRIPIICPWFMQHTGASKTGSYLVEPCDANRWAGSFVCYHSSTHANDNHLRDLRTWVFDTISQLDASRLHAANVSAPEFSALAPQRTASG